ncbi:hypothetical protein OG589_36875 [Sphaerisporangium sp. NBC_01403]|uniref:hypothetical protein n=1 Tax=Sphaerisporangium sp. NBC_01403 TaxID=2903599 RepID=UPI003256362A
MSWRGATAGQVLVIAKEPVPGKVKTRLTPPFTPEESAGLAAAALADGNIGIGGDPEALLRRARELVRSGGTVITEVLPPQTASRVDRVRLRRGGAAGEWFTWATVSAADMPDLARDAGFTRTGCWSRSGRWFAHLC